MIDLGPHGFYIAAAYAATALIVVGLILRAVLDHRTQTRALAELADRGVARRSDSREAHAILPHEAGAGLRGPSVLDPGE